MDEKLKQTAESLLEDGKLDELHQIHLWVQCLLWYGWQC